jgi:CBS domain-containing protein
MEPPDHGPALLATVERLTHVDRWAPLDTYRHQVLELIRSGLAAEEDPLRISARVAEANDALTRRLLQLAEADLGPPPLRYQWLALGSHGRQEQVLSSDQDHAIAYERPPPGQELSAESYFRELAGLVVPALAHAGLPLCTGGYMATSWCQPLDAYAAMFRGWVQEPQPLALLRAEVFLDTRACHGDLATDVLDRILLLGGTRGPFRAQLARAAVTFRPPLARFGRLRGRGAVVDVKLGGAAAIVLLARLYALTAGSPEHNTVRRLRASADAGTLSSATVESLIEGHRFLTGLRLRHQVDQVLRGEPADNRIPLEILTVEQRQRLRATLRFVRDLQDVTAMRFSTSSVM